MTHPTQATTGRALLETLRDPGCRRTDDAQNGGARCHGQSGPCENHPPQLGIHAVAECTGFCSAALGAVFACRV